MRNLYIFLTILFSSYSSAQTYTCTVQNQTVNSSNFKFDIYIQTTSGEIRLADADFAFNFNDFNFSSPGVSFNSSLPAGYTPDINIVSSNRIVLSILASTTYNSALIISNSAPGSLMGTVTISNISMTTGTAGITWRTSGDVVNISKVRKYNSDNSTTSITDNGTYTDPSDAPLPVELSSFTVLVNLNNVNLSWKTATEIDNSGFEVQRKTESREPGSWEKVGFVLGHGNSNSPKEYSFVDKNLTEKAKFVYRLKQIDNDGKYQYSKEVEVEVVPKQYMLYQNYPDPFNPSTTIKFDLPQASQVNLTVYNILGERVITLVNGMEEAGYHSIVFNAGNLASGTYIYKLQTPNFIQTKKMLVLK